MAKTARIKAMQSRFSIDRTGRLAAFGLVLDDGSKPAFLISREGLRALIQNLQHLTLKLRERALAAGTPGQKLDPDALDPVQGLNFVNSGDGSHTVLRARRRSGRTAIVHLPANGIPGVIDALQKSQKVLQDNRRKVKKR
jgi:hypothetical protein